MANEDQRKILQQGILTWNEWRMQHPEVTPDLNYADLSFADLNYANLSGAHLTGAHLGYASLKGADLVGAHLIGADLSFAGLSGADLRGAHLNGTDLSSADLSRTLLLLADLSGARLNGAKLNSAKLNDADLSYADLSYANLSGAHLNNTHLRNAQLNGANLSFADLRAAQLSGADVTKAMVGWTVFGDVDLQGVKGLETIEHQGPSTIGVETLERSQGSIPERFLRQAGMSDTFLAYARSLVIAPIEYATCFLSYSSKDAIFAERLRADLQSEGVRCWFAPEDLRIGDKFWHKIDESIRMYDKVMVVLSEHSVKSEWVEREVIAALEKESKQKRTVLFPIRLDESILQLDPMPPWANDIRRQRHIGNFCHWKDHDTYQQALERLLRDLQADGSLTDG